MNYKKDAMLNTLGNFSYLGALWLMSVLVVRLAGFENAGLFSLAMTSSNIYISLASYTIRLYYAADIKEQFSDAQYIFMRLITVVSSIMLCIGVSVLLGYSKMQLTAIILFYFYKSAEMLSDILFGTLQRHGKLYLSGYSMILKSVLSFFSFVIVLYYTQNLILALIAMVILAVGILLFVDIPFARHFQNELFDFTKESYHAAKRILVICFPLFVVGLCYNIIPSIPRLVFERIYSAEQFGIYSSISTITVLISTAVNCVTLPTVPKMSLCYNTGDKKGLLRITFWSIGLTILLGIISIILARLFGERILTLLFGDKVIGYTNILCLVILAATCSAVIICLNNFFVAVDRQTNILFGCIPGTVLCILLAAPLCEKYYMKGITYCLIVSQSVEIVIMIICVIKILNSIHALSGREG